MATLADVPALAAMLTRAFLDDPVSLWACKPDRLRPMMLERFHTTRVRQMIAGHEVWVTGERDSAALWSPPQRWKLSAREDLGLARSMLYARLLPRAPLVVGGLLGMERRHPSRPPHWYLAQLGTDPSVQGQGRGSAVLKPVLAQAESDGIGVYLECSKERNIDFYARHGFRVTDELRLLRGPKLWPMWREPRAG